MKSVILQNEQRIYIIIIIQFVLNSFNFYLYLVVFAFYFVNYSYL